MSNKLRIDPEKLKNDLRQMGNELASLTSVFKKVKFDINKNTVQSIKDYDKMLDDLNDLTNLYVTSFKSSIDDLVSSVSLIENTDEIIAKGIANKSIYANQKAQDKQRNRATYDNYYTGDTPTNSSYYPSSSYE